MASFFLTSSRALHRQPTEKCCVGGGDQRSQSLCLSARGIVRGQLATQADWRWPGPTVVGLASTVGLAVAGQLWILTSTDGPPFLAMHKGHIFGSIKLANVLGIKLLLYL